MIKRPPFRDSGKFILFTLAFAILLRVFVISAFRIPTAALVPKLLKGDLVLVLRLAYGIPNPFFPDARWAAIPPKRGDFVIFHHPTDADTMYAREVVGLEGDRIQIKKGVIWRNEQPLDKTIDMGSTQQSEDPFVVLPGHFFVLDSSDGMRYWGMVPYKKLEGQILLVLFSLNWVSGRSLPHPRWNRFFHTI